MSRLRYDPSRLQTIADPAMFGRVAVLMGGDSAEREISLKSGTAVHAALCRRGVDAVCFDPHHQSLLQIKAQGIDRVWIALHGPGGEDGSVQGALDYLGVPYTGSGVLGSALCMDKLRTKQLAGAVGIATADSVLLKSSEDLPRALARLGLPLIVKPSSQGSSVGMSKVERAEDFEAAWVAAIAHDSQVFAEAWISGAEYTVSILQGETLPAIRIETPRSFYDYDAKYLRNDTRYHCPSGLSSDAENHLAALARGAFAAVAAEGWGRVDFMMDERGRALLLEINTVPGMTDHSLVPMAARAAGMDFETLVWRILETSLVRES